MNGRIIQPPIKLRRFRRPRQDGEVRKPIYDVYRILHDSKRHILVYRGYADLDSALQAKSHLQNKTGDVCYVVSNRNTRSVKRGTRQT